jgi:hypothetical protein
MKSFTHFYKNNLGQEISITVGVPIVNSPQVGVESGF